ncbi:transporter substrate-binding domain-containing protein [Acuticoccus sp. M5D2P5]|uniref:transporter substrate-binding domain-containing protein n=1 Tax=Acuticoccus kalidii TaxID=2910977 RepID=UPI001F470FC8|nr:transporter substrate-binding domain-containing protein [Acuticoccus kalidii]MCF3934797.1 transporter substrate-binding domain-containing protein [Acuticoccus kalidii]
MSNKTRASAAAVVSAMTVLATAGLSAAPAHADLLDDVKSRGTLRCGVMLDFPPAGFRNADGEAAGFDVDYCGDLAKTLGVEYEVVETPSPDRIPALISGRVDVSVAGASITAERAQTIDFSRPYATYPWVVVTKEANGIGAFEDLASRTVGGVRGTLPEIMMKAYSDENWSGEGYKYLSYNSDSEKNLALDQGRIEAFVGVATAAAATVSLPQFSEFEICCEAPFDPDIVGMMVRKNEPAMLDAANAFVAEQIESGRYQELYQKWYGLDGPDVPETADAVLAPQG